MSTCLPLPPDFCLSPSCLFPLSSSSSSAHFFVFFFCLVLADLFISSRRTRRARLATTFILGPCTTPKAAKRVVSRKFRPRTPSSSSGETVRPMPNSFPRRNHDASFDRSKATSSAGIVFSLIPRLGERMGRERPVRFFPRNYTRSHPRRGGRGSRRRLRRQGGLPLVLVSSIIRGSTRGLIRNEMKSKNDLIHDIYIDIRIEDAKLIRNPTEILFMHIVLYEMDDNNHDKLQLN